MNKMRERILDESGNFVDLHTQENKSTQERILKLQRTVEKIGLVDTAQELQKQLKAYDVKMEAMEKKIVELKTKRASARKKPAAQAKV